MKSIAWAIILAGIFIATSLEKIAKPDREYTDAEGRFTLIVMAGFVLSLLPW